jgi:type I restriction enzyme S subunit
MSYVNGLPHTWCNAKISEISSVNPTLDKVGIPDDLDISFVPMPAVQAESGIIDVSGIRKFSEVKKGYTPFREGDVLFAKITPCMENGKMAVVPGVINGLGFGSTEFHVLRALSGINAKFIYYYVSSQAFRREAEHNMSGAVGQRRVTTPYLSACEVPLPPTNEQHRIVAKIEELFSELDKGIENLKTARAQLKVYRQALLKHAFEGKLTAQWRAENQGKLETAEALLKRIQQERAERYQQQLADWEKSPSIPLLQRGKTTGAANIPPFVKGGLGGISKPKAPKSLSPLTAEELAELPELPEGWLGARLGWLTCSVEYGTSAKSAESGACPVLRMGNIQNGKFDWTDLVYTDDETEIAKYLLREGDVLFNRTNSPELVGKSAIFKSRQPAIFAGYIIRVNQIATIVESQYLNYFLNSHIAKQHGNTVKTDGVNQSNINGEKLVNYPFPFCPVEEQKVIVELLDARLSEVDQLDQTLTTSLQQAEALRQSILKRAFSGQLVPQDPNDEPASVLLERIQAEKVQLGKLTPSSRGKKTVTKHWSPSC